MEEIDLDHGVGRLLGHAIRLPWIETRIPVQDCNCALHLDE